jgi:hypothetical protein
MEAKSEIHHRHNIELVRFQRACDQIIQLNGKLDDISKRYLSAKNNNNKFFRCSLRSRILVVEGMLTAYCKYAELKKLQILKLRRKLHDGSSSENDDMTSDDEY